MNPRVDRSPEHVRQALRDAMARRGAAQTELDSATRHLAETIALARDAGMPMTIAAEVTGLSRETLYNLLQRHGGR